MPSTRTNALPAEAAAVLKLLPTTRDQWTHWPKETDGPGTKRVKTECGRLTDGQVWRLMQDENTILALKHGKRVPYLIIDIDHGSPYRKADIIQKIIRLFARRHVDLHIFESSESGGVHLLAIFDRPVLIGKVIKFAAPLLKHNDYKVVDGCLEVYPSETTRNKAVRVPFQKGFRPLSEELEPLADYPTPAARCRQFLWLAQNRPTMARHANMRPPVPSKKLAAKDCQRLPLKQERFELGKRLYENGLERAGSRHESLKEVGYFLCMNRIEPEERERLINRWIHEKHNHYSRDWLLHPRRVQEEIHRMVWHGIEKGKCLSGDGKVFAERNLREAARIENAIIQAVDTLRRSGELYFKNGRINRSTVERAAAIDKKTARKYWQLIDAEAKNPL